MRVSNATVREGRSGRVWPPDVLRKFQMAEVATESTINHYVLRDTSISPVGRSSAVQRTIRVLSERVNS